jgi:Tfp pilus assembly protein PilF
MGGHEWRGPEAHYGLIEALSSAPTHNSQGLFLYIKLELLIRNPVARSGALSIASHVASEGTSVSRKSRVITRRGGVTGIFKRTSYGPSRTLLVQHSIGSAGARERAFRSSRATSSADLFDLGRFDTALANCDQLLALRPNDAHALNMRGLILETFKRPEEALASYDKAVAAAPEVIEALYNRGNILADLSRFEEALASYDKALTVAPEAAPVLNNRGLVLEELKRFEEALASYEKALKIKPDYGAAVNNRRLVLEEIERLRTAAAKPQALDLRPRLADSIDETTLICRLAGPDPKAVKVERGMGVKAHAFLSPD